MKDSLQLLLFLFCSVLFLFCKSCKTEPTHMIGRIVPNTAQKEKQFHSDRSYLSNPEQCCLIDINDNGLAEFGVLKSRNLWARDAKNDPKVGQVWIFSTPTDGILDDGVDYLLKQIWPDTTARGRVVSINPVKIKLPDYPNPATPGPGPLDKSIAVGDSVICGPYLKAPGDGSLIKDAILRVINK